LLPGNFPRDSHVVIGTSVAREILDHADEIAADLIVMTTHGRHGMARFFLGSTTERVLRTASVPVLTVRVDKKAD
jgi:nucleotide-binding universal stress UspA family protein